MKINEKRGGEVFDADHLRRYTLGDTAQSMKRQTKMHKNGHVGSNRRRLIEMPSSKQVDAGAQRRPLSRKSLLRSAAWAGQVEIGCQEVWKILNSSS